MRRCRSACCREWTATRSPDGAPSCTLCESAAHLPDPQPWFSAAGESPLITCTLPVWWRPTYCPRPLPSCPSCPPFPALDWLRAVWPFAPIARCLASQRFDASWYSVAVVLEPQWLVASDGRAGPQHTIRTSCCSAVEIPLAALSQDEGRDHHEDAKGSHGLVLSVPVRAPPFALHRQSQAPRSR